MARLSARNVSRKVPFAAALRFLAAARELGLRFETLLDVGRQLVSERFKQARKVRRRTFQSVLAFDIFLKYLTALRPDFATFFTNHVASSMHRYWAATFPGDYDQFDLDDGWVKTYSQEIDWTMHKADQFLARLARFADAHPDYQLWICTSMGQAATKARRIDTELFVTDMARFTRALGLEAGEWELMPAMLPQYALRVKPPRVAAFRETLATFAVAGRPVKVQEAKNGCFAISLGHANLQETGAMLGGRHVPFELLGLAKSNIEDLTGATAYHIPQGCLFIYDPTDRARREGRTEVSTREIAPAILKNFSVPVPKYMWAAPALA
jgi:hypothetical protein